MKLEVTLLDGTVIEPQFDEKHKKEVVEHYRKLAQNGKIKAFCATHGYGTPALENEEPEEELDSN